MTYSESHHRHKNTNKTKLTIRERMIVRQNVFVLGLHANIQK